MTTDAASAMIWASDHLNLLGWPMLVGIVWKFKGNIDNFFAEQKIAFNNVGVTLAAVEDTKAEVLKNVRETMASVESAKVEAFVKVAEIQSQGAQHAKDLMANIAVLDTNHLTHIESDMKAQTTLLASIDKGISVLVDRSTTRRGK